jgi:hypothetical protein
MSLMTARTLPGAGDRGEVLCARDASRHRLTSFHGLEPTFAIGGQLRQPPPAKVDEAISAFPFPASSSEGNRKSTRLSMTYRTSRLESVLKYQETNQK